MASTLTDTPYTTAILQFLALLRRKGLNVGIPEGNEAIEAAVLGLIHSPHHFRYALRAICCCSEEDCRLFDQCFDQYWAKLGATAGGFLKMINQAPRQKVTGSVVMMGKGQTASSTDEGKSVSGANREARLRRTDFAKVSEIESEWLEEIAMKLWKQMSLRLKRRMMQATAKESLDIRRSIRNSIRYGGELIELKEKGKKPKRQRLVILLDVSGSMDKYSFFLLRFICALRMHFRQIEAFIFSTHLIRITEYLYTPHLDRALALLSQQVDNWSSGTQIGACLQYFNEHYAKRVLGGTTHVIVLSDGLDTGEPEVLKREMTQLRRRANTLIWLNPLKGMEGYQPTARGMKAALPQVDVFRSAHNLDSILELENFLINV